MKKCVVIGGGFAGLSAGVYLSKADFQVEILEASPKLGGRAFSFKEPHTETVVDNGQHILMGCYKETLEFFKLIQAGNNLIRQKNLRVNFLKENFNKYSLNAFPFPYPFNLSFGLLNYRAVSVADRLKILSLFVKLFLKSKEDLNVYSVYEWLIKENQNENTIKGFWEILAVSALNSSIHEASAKIFSDILKEIFLNGNKSSTLILPKYGLSETYCKDSREYIEGYEGKINLTEEVKELVPDSGRIKVIKTNKREIVEFDYIISAVPPYALEKFLPSLYNFDELKFKYSCILTIHLWLRENPLDLTFYGLINSPVHWIFNHGSHVTLVISDANKYLNSSKEEIIEMVSIELDKFVGIKKRDIKFSRVIKEKRSTFIPSREIINRRPQTVTQIENFFLSGDWTDTGLPSTIESAVKSGKTAAEKIIKHVNHNKSGNQL